jgi:hypothetical protein
MKLPLKVEIVDENDVVVLTKSGKPYSHIIRTESQLQNRMRAIYGRAAVLNSRGMNVRVKQSEENV